MLSISREERVLAYLRDHGKASITELSQVLAVSEPTIRRDLRQMAARNMVRRVYGGAVLENAVGYEPPVLQRRGLYAEEKERIGRAAAGLVEDGDTLILLGGSTTMEVLPHIVNKKDITLITNSLLVAERAAKYPEITPIMLGGIVRHSELSTEGHMIQLCLGELHANKVILGARAISFATGLMLDRVPEVTVFRDCLRIADEVILVADHSKFGQVATAVLGPITVAQCIVTDRGVADDTVTKLRELGVSVILA